MYEGICPKCGRHYYGWALANPRYQMCDKDGTALEILVDGKVVKGYSPFTAEEYTIKPTNNSVHPEHKTAEGEVDEQTQD